MLEVLSCYIMSLIHRLYAKNQAKWEAADEWCKDRGYEFKVFTEKELGIRYGT